MVSSVVNKKLMIFIAGLSFIWATSGSNIAFASNAVIINQSVPTNKRASVNGLGMTIGSIAKAIGPFSGSVMFAWSLENKMSFPFNYYFVFLMIFLLSYTTFLFPTGLSFIERERIIHNNNNNNNNNNTEMQLNNNKSNYNNDDNNNNNNTEIELNNNYKSNHNDNVTMTSFNNNMNNGYSIHIECNENILISEDKNEY